MVVGTALVDALRERFDADVNDRHREAVAAVPRWLRRAFAGVRRHAQAGCGVGRTLPSSRTRRRGAR